MGPGNMIALVAEKSVGLNAPVFAEFLGKILQPAQSSVFYATRSIQASWFKYSWDVSACVAVSSAAE